MRLSLRQRLLVARLGIFSLVTVFFVLIYEHIYGFDGTIASRSFWTFLVVAFIPLLVYAAMELVVYRYLNRVQAAQLQDFVEQIKSGSTKAPKIPELQPVIDAFRAKEAELRAERNRIVWILRHIPGGLLTIDQQEQITFAACPALEDLGLPVNTLVGQPHKVFREMIDTSDTPSPLRDALREGIKSRRITRIADHYFEAVNTPMINQNRKIDGAVCLFIDVTERVLREQDMKRMERLSLVGQMSASLSHEIRNPLTVIDGFLQLYAAKPYHEHADEQFQLLIGEIRRVTQIVQEFLALSHNSQEDWSQLSLAQIVRQMSPLLGSEAEIHGVALQLQLLDTPALYLHDNDMKQLLLNLYRNALEACGDDGVVRLVTGVDETGHPFLQVQDNGCGMPPQVLERLGTPFNSTKSLGTGLGLPLCMSVAERCGAKLTFTHCAGGGTLASVVFPPPLASDSFVVDHRG